MEKDNRSTACNGKEAEVQCPICGAPTLVCPDRSSDSVGVIFSAIHHQLYHTRTCQGCFFSFSGLIIGEKIWAFLEPYLAGFLPRRRRVLRFVENDTPIHVPSRHGVVPRHVNAGERPASLPLETVTRAPFSIDPVKRTVSINLECSIGEGEFGDQMMVAATSLESNLRVAADQIRSLVDCHAAEPKDPRKPGARKATKSKQSITPSSEVSREIVK